MTGRKPLYAYAVERKDGTLAILHSRNPDACGILSYDKYRILVSLSREAIERHGNSTTGAGLEHKLIDIAPLIEGGIISKEVLECLD